MTIGCIGGTWNNGDMPGVICREVYHTSSHLSNYVASSDISRLIKYYTDFHDVDEDGTTISIQGGEWPAGNTAGIMVRFVIDSPSSAWDTVTSSNI